MVRVVTFGCRLNALESEHLQRQAQKIGLQNCVIINSCAITAEAERQVRQAVRKIARENPTTRLIVTGCAGTFDPTLYAALPQVIAVIPNEKKHDLGTWQALVDHSAPSQEENATKNPGLRARAYIAIQNGCDHFCSYCLVPKTRGRSRSLPYEEILKSLRVAFQQGYPEVVLTGVDIAAYRENDLTLGQLVQRLLHDVPELPQLRLSSLDPAAIDASLVEAWAKEPRLMPHAHLSLQSGAPPVLREMNRRHTSESVQVLCAGLRAARPDIVFGADLIAGFPTEQAKDVDQTLDLLSATGITFLHVFPYSVRPETPAAALPTLPRSVVLERARRLRQWGAAALRQRFAPYIGQILPILGEKAHQGRTPHFFRVMGTSLSPRRIAPMRIIGCNETFLLADVLEKDASRE
ncbi:MAG: MiaB/RimO family radical SAM methylthiotransferase [Holosporales bacterium]|jgi:threonylcarbamoyladenosine tRNA methylthiotransferase MtaB|nr:MiaB/RimO family radical SAM methylthiotransferase [Holosporales bacterium]